ncbi:MAG: PPOX class F420-dependent oxidoreductase [bacterium]|nr:PPOX class F420-dependent oxidoreductase [bacterium]
MNENAAKIPESHAALLKSKALIHLATVMKDGSPQVSPIWFSTEGELILLNSAKGRLKDRNMRRQNKVALALVDPDNPFRYVGIRGTVVEITEEGAEAHIDRLAKKYLGLDTYPHRKAGDVRVIYRIRPDKVHTMG